MACLETVLDSNKSSEDGTPVRGTTSCVAAVASPDSTYTIRYNVLSGPEKVIPFIVAITLSAAN